MFYRAVVVNEVKPERELLQAALLASERVRILAISFFFATLLVVYSVRIAVFDLALRWTSIAALLTLLAVEFAVYRAVVKAQRAHLTVHPGIWIGSLLAEVSVPAFCVAFLPDPTVPQAYRPLISPWGLLLFPVIGLTTLRLKPSLSCFAGVTAAALYLAAAHYNGWRFAIFNPAHTLNTQGSIFFYALILLGSGVAAGAVASEIRKHAEGALAEIVVRQELKHVQDNLDIARSIQQSLLPQVRPSMRGFEIAGWNHSADATGGDYFDWIRCSDGRLVITLADVTGHGIGPALLASLCRAYSRATFQGTGTLVGTMQAINRLLAADLGPPHFVTLVAVVCNETDGTVQLLSAGQGPLFLYSCRSNSFSLVESHSIPLGLLADIAPENPAALTLETGDLIILLTDGFMEWQNAEQEQFGADRLTETVRRVHHLKPEHIIAELYKAVVAFGNGTNQQDDVTAVVIKRVAIDDDFTSTPEQHPGLREQVHVEAVCP